MPRQFLIGLAEKLDLVPRSAMLTSRYRVVRSLGSLAFALLMLFSVRRTKWLYSKGCIPRTRIERRVPTPVTELDVRLCDRLLVAHSRAIERQHSDRSTNGMWSWIYDARQQRLATTLERNDPHQLAQLMTSMFAEDFVLGMAAGPLISQTGSNLRARAWGLKCLDGLASLAEVLGVVAVENPEQGGVGLAFEAGLPRLFTDLEAELGFRIDFPEVGAPAGLAVEGRLITPDTPDQIYAALRLDEVIGLHVERMNDAEMPLRIVEIGGGYGAMCYWFTKFRDEFTSYTIVDLPVVNVLQGYFLGRVLGEERVSFFGETTAQIGIVPNFALNDVERPFEILVNKDSMPEMPSDTRIDYLQWGASSCSGLFYSYNQEAAMQFLGEPQGVVHKTIKELGGFERIRRDRAWVRDGYVEEIYVPMTTAHKTSL